MKISEIFGFWFLAGLLLGCISSHAADAKYPAIEEESSIRTLPATLPAQTVSEKKELKTDLSRDTFYTIPDSKIDALAERLKIVHEILMLHKRAYDYQKLTLKELKAIKKELSQNELSKI